MRYRASAGDAEIAAKAPAELAEARAALERAEEAHSRGATPEEVALLGYLADRRVRFARWAAVRKPGEEDRGAAFADSGQEVLAWPDRERDLADLRARSLAVEPGARGLVLTLDRGLFDGTTLNPPARSMLERTAAFLREHPGYGVSIEGHTDSMGADSYNDRVSLERAQAVMDELQQQGIAGTRMSVRGFGARRPRVSNDSRVGRQINRRVELVIAPSVHAASGTGPNGAPAHARASTSLP
jgi:outer membrane protein OmpA-like peptidoglycan-associated protein